MDAYGDLKYLQKGHKFRKNTKIDAPKTLMHVMPFHFATAVKANVTKTELYTADGRTMAIDIDNPEASYFNYTVELLQVFKVSVQEIVNTKKKRYNKRKRDVCLLRYTILNLD